MIIRDYPPGYYINALYSEMKFEKHLKLLEQDKQLMKTKKSSKADKQFYVEQRYL